MREDEKQLGDCRDDSDEGLTAREREQDVISSSIAEDRRRERQQAREEVQFYEEVGTRLLEKIIEEGKINPELLKLVKDMLKTDWWRVLLRVIAETGQSEVVKLKDGEVHLPGGEQKETAPEVVVPFEEEPLMEEEPLIEEESLMEEVVIEEEVVEPVEPDPEPEA